MSRYTGPRLKIMRALGTELPGLSRKSTEKRPHPPGQHGLKMRRVSDFGKKRIRPGDEITLREKALGIPAVIESLGAPALTRPEWLDFDQTARKARMTRTPRLPDLVRETAAQSLGEWDAMLEMRAALSRHKS